MCGRYTLTTPLEALRRLFEFLQSPNLAPLYNVAPTMAVPIVRRAGGERELITMRWGLVPPWAKDISFGARAINARAETIAAKPAFREAFVARRCLVPADGYYEWRSEAGLRQPYRLARPDGGPMGFAGLWETWRPRETGSSERAEAVTSFTILTVAARGPAAEVHARMPLVVEASDYAEWLADGALRQEDGARLLAPREVSFAITRVSTRVNNVRNNDSACIEPDTAPPAAPTQGALPL